MSSCRRRASQYVITETNTYITLFATPGHLASCAERTPLYYQSCKRSISNHLKHYNRYIYTFTSETSFSVY